MSAPTARHEGLVRWLDGLARLTGHHAARTTLPGGGRPDVLRADCRGWVFLGEAKASEGPGEDASRGRLAGYLDVAPTRLGHVTVAVEDPWAALGWAGCLGELLPSRWRVRLMLDEDISVAWASRGGLQDLDVQGLARLATELVLPRAQ
jgi:hypothetical protein